jgi:6-phosphogluconolactonase (cycloisomerase 2 family)
MCWLAAGSSASTPKPALIQVSGSPFATAGSNGMAVSPGGSLLVEADPENNGISVYSVASDGRLSQVPNSPFAADAPQTMAFNPAGTLLAVTGGESGDVSIYSVASDGTLTELGSPVGANGAARVVFSPNGKLLAVAEGNGTVSNPGAVGLFSVGSNGTLSEVSGSPFAAGTGTESVAFNPSGTLLAASNEGGDVPSASTVSLYSIGTDDSVSQVTGSPFATGYAPYDVAFSPNGRLLVTADSKQGQGAVSVFSVGSGGALSKVTGSPFASAADTSIVAFSPSGNMLAAIGPNDAAPMSVFRVSSAGALSPVAGSPFTISNKPPAYPSDVAFSRDGQFLDVSAGLYQAGDVTAVFQVVPPAPVSMSAPTIAGVAKVDAKLTCEPGSWLNNPTSFASTWDRDGTPIAGATESTYTAHSADEGSTLTCLVVAKNLGGSAVSAASHGVTIPVPRVSGCPAATGRASATKLGPLSLGMTKAQAHRAEPHSRIEAHKTNELFCLTPAGLRAGFAPGSLLSTLTTPERRQYTGRVVWITTANARYAIRGVRVGESVKSAAKSLKLGKLIAVSGHHWYVVPDGPATAILQASRGVVTEVGIAAKPLTRTGAALKKLLASVQ